MTNLPKRARIAGLIALALTVATFALPAQASGLSGVGSSSMRDMGSSDYDYSDCLSKSEIKHWFADEYELKQISVQRADKHYLYLVSGYAKAAEKAALSEMSSSKKIHYVFLFDACHEEVVQQIRPKLAM